MVHVISFKKKQKFAIQRFEAGFTFIDALVGITLLVIIFSGLFGAYQLGLKTLIQTEHRVIAGSIANELLEQARNLSYAEVGVQGAYPDGFFAATQPITRNEVVYTAAVDVNYVADDSDGLTMPDDSCINDYKRMLVTVSWQGRFAGDIAVAGDIAPKNTIQECGDAGGLLRINVFDAVGLPISNASVNVRDVDTALTDVCSTSDDGMCQLLLPTSPLGGGENYRIEITKAGYSSTETFRTGDVYNGKIIATPENSHATLLEGEITSASFAIDLLSSFSIETRSSRGRKEFVDLFDDADLLFNLENTEAQDGNLQLTDDDGAFPSFGTATSITITDVFLVGWGKIIFQKVLPLQTDLKVQALYYDGFSWTLVPEEDLPGNTAGFSSSPVDISFLNVVSYPQLRMQGNLTSTDPAATPSLNQWGISYFTLADFPLGNIPFYIIGDKAIGEDSTEEDIYKYNANVATGSTGFLTLDAIEWDNYTFLVDGGLTIVETVPAPQPISLAPNATQSAILYLAAENSLLINVQELGTGIPIFSASIHLTGTGFDETQSTNANGQTLFLPLEAATYTIEVQAEGYENFTDAIVITGNTSTIIELQLNPE